MNDYIDRQAAIDAVVALMPGLTTADGTGQFDAEIYREQELVVDIGQVLNDLPPAEVEPVKHGRWTKIGHIEHTWLVSKCSECGYQTIDAGNYCPNCGARMDAEEAEP